MYSIKHNIHVLETQGFHTLVYCVHTYIPVSVRPLACNYTTEEVSKVIVQISRLSGIYDGHTLKCVIWSKYPHILFPNPVLLSEGLLSD